MNRRLNPIVASLTLVFACVACTSNPRSDHVGERWKTFESADAAGWSAKKLADAEAMSAELGSAAVMVVERGHVIAAWGDVAAPMKTYSVRKSLLSLLFGNPVASGDIDLSATLGQMGVDDATPLLASEKSARVVDLLTSTSAVYLPAAKEPPSLSSRPARGSVRPGEAWWYNNWGFNAALEIYERRTGEKLPDAFGSEIALPIGMEDFDPDNVFYEFEPNKSNFSAYEFLLSARDLARIGVLVLRKGVWNGIQLVPAEWIRRSTTRHWSFNETAGYGYMWWINPGRTGVIANPADHPKLNEYDHVAALGSYGQVVMILPALDLVIVHRGYPRQRGVSDAAALKLIDKILQARTVGVTGSPASRDAELPDSRTSESLSTLDLTPPMEEEMAALAGRYRIGRGGMIEVYVWRSKLFATGPRPKDSHLQLLKARDGSYTSRSLPIRIRFSRNQAGDVDSLTLVFGEMEIEAKRE